MGQRSQIIDGTALKKDIYENDGYKSQKKMSK
jgi:hypothetical protein